MKVAEIVNSAAEFDRIDMVQVEAHPCVGGVNLECTRSEGGVASSNSPEASFTGETATASCAWAAVATRSRIRENFILVVFMFSFYSSVSEAYTKQGIVRLGF